MTLTPEQRARQLDATAMSAMLRSAAAQQRIVDALTARPASTTAQIAHRVGRSTSAVKRAIAHLVAAGVVTQLRDPDDGRMRRYVIAADTF